MLEVTTPPQVVVDETLEINQKIEATIKAAERLEIANQKAEALLSRQILSGKSAGSEPAPQMTPEEQKKNDTINFFKGSAIEDAVKKHG